MPDPDPMAIFDHVYADGHALVDEERAAVRRLPGIVRRTHEEGACPMTAR